MAENLETKLADATQPLINIVKEETKRFKEEADKEIQLLKECIKSYNEANLVHIVRCHKKDENLNNELHKTARNIHAKLEILNSKAEIYKDKKRPGIIRPINFRLISAPFSDEKPYFGNTLSGLETIHRFFKDLKEYRIKTTDDRISLEEIRKNAEEEIINIELASSKWESLHIAEQEIERDKKYDELLTKTEIIRKEIHQGALIESFNETTKELKQLKTKWYGLFFGVVGCLVFFGITEIFKIDKTKVLDWYWIIPIHISLTLDSPSDIFNLNSLIHKLSLVLPLIWLAWFAAKRLNILSKLETDYQFKEATAKTFESYKKEIEALKDDELKKQLLSTVIRNFGDNPVRLFDPKDDKGHTTEELLELAKKLKDITK
jgi:hypothetical protein